MKTAYRVLFRVNKGRLIDNYTDDVIEVYQFLTDIAFLYLGKGQIWVQSKHGDFSKEFGEYYSNEVIRAKKQAGIIKPLY